MKKVMYVDPKKASRIIVRLHKFYYSQILSQVYDYFDLFDNDEEFRTEICQMAVDMASHLIEEQGYYIDSLPIDTVKDGLLPFVMPNVLPDEDNEDGWGGYELNRVYATYKEVYTIDDANSLNFCSDIDKSTKVKDGEFYLDISDILFCPMMYDVD